MHVHVYYFSSTDFSILPTRGPCSKYDITDEATGDSFRGKLTFKVEGEPFKVFNSCTCMYIFMYVHDCTCIYMYMYMYFGNSR